MISELKELVSNSAMFRSPVWSEPLPRSRAFSDRIGPSDGSGDERLRSLVEDEAFYWQPTPLSWY